MLNIDILSIANGDIKKQQIAQSLFEQTDHIDNAPRFRILSQLKKACEVAMNEIPVEYRTITDINTGETQQEPVSLASLAIEDGLRELAKENRTSGDIIVSGAAITISVREKFDFNADKGKGKDDPKLIEHPRHEAVKTWHEYDDKQAELKKQSAICTRKKSDAVKDYRDAYPDAQPTSVEITISIPD